MNELPDPLTPVDCDLSDFQYMELDVRRLRDSKFSASPNAEAFRAGVLLWCAAWHQVPAASLPDDDMELANLAGYGRVVKEWKKVRVEALYGFVKCSDGRLYHAVIAEKAISAFQAKLKHAYGKLLERLRKENKKRSDEKSPLVGIPTFEQWKSGGYDNGIPPELPPNSGGIPPENALRGNREGTEQNGEGAFKKNSVPNGTGASPPDPKSEKAKTPEEMARAELWIAGKSLLTQKGMPKDQCGSFVGKLCKDYGDDIAVEAVRITVAKQAADPAEFMKATCQRLKGEKKSAPPWWISERSINAKGEELGMSARPGESMSQYKARIEEAIAEAERDKAPA